MRSSVVLGIIATLAAAGCGCHHATCREPCAGTAAVVGSTPAVQPAPLAAQESLDRSESTYQAPRSYQTERRYNEVPAEPGGKTYGHADDYTWLIGRLQKISTPTEQWKIRYAPLDEEDQWGGSMVLAPDARLAQYRDGEVVYLEGQIIAPRPSLYRLRIIRPFGARLSAAESEEFTE
jgi:hypothetical protein